MSRPSSIRAAFAAAILATTALIGLSAPAQAAPDPVTCAGYAEKRQFVSIQSWWMADPARGLNGTSEGHAHLEGCLPERETLTGTVPFDLRVTMHDNPGKANYVSMVVKGQSQETTYAKRYLNGLTCPAGTCSTWVHFDLPVSAFNNSGLQEIRFRLFVPQAKAADGTAREMRDNLNFQAYIANGKSRGDVTRYPYLRGKGWYTHGLYCEASLRQAIPDQPVSGVWKPTVAMVNHGADDLPVTHHTVRIDPDFHATPPTQGTVVVDGAGQYGPSALTIDTTKLTNGVHKLHLRADCDNRTLGSVNSGVVVVPFTVAN